ncbi:hypothetical protein ACQP2F_30435 [Actinoplanes sp. CA-030573]|uniref:hypothetical protein n=1 Tax=Actinoplanes sp. CA-030573 TaxID=3239898 RepID=UPI003D8C18AC
MARLLVTVGMGSWPFDRLVAAVAPLCAYHDVFVQRGTSAVTPPCPHDRYIPFDEMQHRLAEADIVITHAGSTVRLVQRLGRIPIVVARRRRLGETGSDRQERFLRTEEDTGRVHAVADVVELPAAVAAFTPSPPPALPPVVDPSHLVATMDDLVARLRR